MKRFIQIISCIAVVCMAFASCEDNRLDNMAEDRIRLATPGFQSFDVFEFEDYTCEIYVFKSGYGSKGGTVSLEVDERALAEYNAREGTAYELLPAGCYQFPPAAQIAADGTRAFMPVVFRTAEMSKLSDAIKYALPVKAVVAQNAIAVDTANISTILSPMMAPLYIMFSETGLSETLYPVGINDPDVIPYKVEIRTNFTNQWDLAFKLAVDQALLDAYNLANDTSFIMLPENACELFPDEWTLPAGVSSKSITLNINKKNLVPGGNYLLGDYVLPLKITEVSGEITPEGGTGLLRVPFLPIMLSKTGWAVTDYNSSITMDAQYATNPCTPDKIIDMDSNGYGNGSWWSSKWAAPFPDLPYYITIDMGAPKTIFQLQICYPIGGEAWRSGYLLNGGGHFEVSDDGTTWTKLIDWERTSDTPRADTYDVPQTTTRYLKLVITKRSGGAVPGAVNIQELEVIGFD